MILNSIKPNTCNIVHKVTFGLGKGGVSKQPPHQALTVRDLCLRWHFYVIKFINSPVENSTILCREALSRLNTWELMSWVKPSEVRSVVYPHLNNLNLT